MFKLYLRTLKKSIKYAAILLGVYFLGSYVLVTIANFFKDVPLLQSLILLGTPALICFGVSIKVRINDRETAKIYRNVSEAFHLKVGADIKQLLRSKSFWLEVAAFCTYLILLCLIGGRIIFTTPAVTTLMLISCVGVFMLLDSVSWLIVHREYLKDKII